MAERTPGVRLVEVQSPFQLASCSVHDTEALISGEPMTVSTSAPPWSYVVSFPLDKATKLPPQALPLAWVTRVRAEVLTGNATLGYLAADGRQLGAERPLRRAETHADLVTDDLSRWAAIVIRVGGESSRTTVKLTGFECFVMPEDQEDAWYIPADFVLAPMSDWNRYYGVPVDLPGYLRYLLFQHLDKPRPMRWLFDLTIEIIPGEQISQAIFVSGLYEPCTMTALRRLLRRGDTFVDVGANMGVFSLVASRWVGSAGRVISIEPSSREFARLQRNVELNGLRNVTTIQAAAGDRCGSGTLHVAAGAHTGLNTLEASFVYSDVVEDHAETVPIATLDEILAAQGVGAVHVMKIDAEGSEPQVMAGARRTIERDRPVMLLEVAGPSLTPTHAGRQEIEGLLGGLGYRFAAIDGHTATIVQVPDLGREAENLIAAPPDVLRQLLDVASGPMVDDR